MFNIDKVEVVYLAIGATDMRKSIDGLSAIVMHQYKLNIYTKAIFAFCNRNKNRIKVLQWDNGFWLYYYRLEKGRLKWPDIEDSNVAIDIKEFKWILKGYEPRITNKLEVKKNKNYY